MEVNLRVRQLVAGMCLAVLAGTGYAAESAIDLAPPASRYFTRDVKSFMLAENDTGVVKSDAGVAKSKNNTAPVAPAAEFEPPLFSGSNAHKFLGLGTIALAAATAMSGPECEGGCGTKPREVNGTHAQLAKATVAMAAATIATGLIYHWDDFNLEDGITDPDNLHVLLGVAGAALMAVAVQKSATSSVPVSHAAMAEAGALGMLVAIKLTW